MAFFHKVLLIAAIIHLASSAFEPEICSVETESYGLIPPPLPTNYELRAEQVDTLRKEAAYFEMYHDYSNSRGKYMYLLKGVEHHSLFDYQTQQVIKWNVWHPGVEIQKDPLSHECTTEDMEESSDKYIFGYVDDATGKPRMYTSGQALRFGGQYQYSFNGTELMENRGILSDKYKGCIYDKDIDMTLAINYTFSNKAIVTSSGTTEAEVTGIDNGYLSVPVKCDFFGTVVADEDGDKAIVQKSESFFWFKGEPEFNFDTFKIPKFMYCEGYRGRKDFPKFPTAFSSTVETTSYVIDSFGEMAAAEWTNYDELYYYQEKKLARRDFLPVPDVDTEIYSKFKSYSPIRSVYDFLEGIVYFSHQESGVCFVRPINSGDFFEGSNSMYIEMATPEHLFLMETDEMEYKGQDIARDIDCDVWTGKFFDKNYNTTVVKETFFSTNGWHADVEENLEHSIPVKHAIMRQSEAFELVEGVSTYNFLKFKASPPKLSTFDVSNCIEAMEHRNFAILLSISDSVKDLLYKYQEHFLETAHYYLTDVSQMITPLRVQNLELAPLSLTDKKTFIFFTLVGKAKLKTQVPVGQSGASLNEAIINLQRFIDTNQFAIKYYPPHSKEMTVVAALEGSLYAKSGDGNLGYVSTSKVEYEAEVQTEVVDESHVMSVENADNDDADNDVDEEDDDENGMTSGSLTFLAIAMLLIGIGIGCAIMYLCIKRTDRDIDDRIQLQTSPDEENPSTEEATTSHVSADEANSGNL